MKMFFLMIVAVLSFTGMKASGLSSPQSLGLTCKNWKGERPQEFLTVSLHQDSSSGWTGELNYSIPIGQGADRFVIEGTQGLKEFTSTHASSKSGDAFVFAQSEETGATTMGTDLNRFSSLLKVGTAKTQLTQIRIVQSKKNSTDQTFVKIRILSSSEKTYLDILTLWTCEQQVVNL